MSKPTCGAMYLEAIRKYANGVPNHERIFAAGFISGQAEKTYLGACRACMFRPSAEKFEMVLELAKEAAKRYGLYWQTLSYCGGASTEIWLHRKQSTMQCLDQLEVNSPEWHKTRAWLCGIPNDEVDEKFHERTGYNEKCD